MAHKGNNNNPNGHLPTLIPGNPKGRFGAPGGPDPSEAGKRGGGSVRAAIRRIAFMHPEDARDMIKRADKDMTMAIAIAAAKFQKALKGDTKAMQQLEDSIDGKLVEKQVKAETTLEELVVGSFEHEQRSEEEGQS